MNAIKILSEINHHLLSEDDVMLHQLLGQAHGVLDVDIVILGAMNHHQGPVLYAVTSSSHAGPGEDMALEHTRGIIISREK